ncbi:sigma 54-interacting transcriptional regulator [Sandaracinus amylolyticus]|uniref:Flagellar regulatory protein FleQ n=1 Tax=Sandaracinus amylolyticus TaxID=927083 RepID=A0A0F6YHJ5_9BACT|nr:sigma 54-interacting transcriptional regulator [Sandaracinus amylolyticus]AKF04713.1 Flagellar regulatory protein FleQ [Sandaracinus amylolyticus]
MASPIERLAPRERDFLARVAAAIAANPFGEERLEIDRAVVGADADVPRAEVLGRMLAKLDARLEGIARGRPLDLRRFTGEDRDLVEAGLLFAVFHRIADALDERIRREIAGERGTVGFARDALAELASRGIDEPQALHYLAIFWQMRRAFFFVETSLPGTSPSMWRLRQSLWNDLFTADLRLYARLLWRRMEDFSTFLAGETGTGKGTAAAAIGRSGFIPYDAKRERFASSFVDAFLAINLAEFPETLVESELFGHEKGAFTGAIAEHAGVFARAKAHGAIFLDEIGEVSQAVQVKLLHVLQERTFRPVGSRAPRRFEGRVIAATNRTIAALRRDGTFRDDLWYRLSADVIEMPTLRQRLDEDPGELDVLIAAILEQMLGEQPRDLIALVREAIARDVGEAYRWPGNVRELAQCVRRVLLTRRYVPELARSAVAEDAEDALLAASGGGGWRAEELIARYCAALHARLGTYEAVAERVGLDRRTVKRHVLAARR